MTHAILWELGLQMRHDTEKFLSRALRLGFDPKAQYRALLRFLQLPGSEAPKQPQASAQPHSPAAEQRGYAAA